MPHVIVVNWRTKAGAEAEVARTLGELAPLVRGEPGCLSFRPHVSRDDPRSFLIYEEYVDEASFEAHRKTPHVQHHVVERLLPQLEHRESISYQRIEDPGAGAVPQQGGGDQAVTSSAIRLVLLRHGEVASHSGDVPLTPAAEEAALLAGRSTRERLGPPVAVLSSKTKRTIRSAELFVAGAMESDAGNGAPLEPRATFALRNPDLFLGGERVDMVSTPEAFAEQVPALSAEECAAIPFFAGFMAAPDRIGWWLRHPSPPGDDQRAVASRILAFARSLADGQVAPGGVIVAITHSPILRAVAAELQGKDPGEPDFFTGLLLEVGDDGHVRLQGFDPFHP